jgi:hypothetical protein
MSDSIFQTIKSNLLYILMLIAIVISMVYDYIYKSEVKHTDEERIIPKSTMIHLVALSGIIIIIVVIQMIRGSQDFQKEAVINVKVPESHAANKVNKEEFKKVTANTTKKELEKLYNSTAFKQKLREKGEDVKNWNWQAKEKAERVVYRDHESSEDEDLSYI